MSSKNYFETVAPKWDTMRTGFFPISVREKAIAEMTIQPNTQIADIGAGTGFITEGMAHLPIQITAIDESENMLSVMQQKFKDNSNIQYVVSESENLKVADNSLDYALANMFLHHVERPASTIAEIYRTLKPNGKLIITDLDKHDFKFLVTEQNDRWMGFERSDIIQWFKAAGFKDIQVDCVNADCCADSCDSDASAKINIFIATGIKR